MRIMLVLSVDICIHIADLGIIFAAQIQQFDIGLIAELNRLVANVSLPAEMTSSVLYHSTRYLSIMF